MSCRSDAGCRAGCSAARTCWRTRSSASCSRRPLVGVLATLEPDGSVHAVPLWLCDAGDAILLATFSRSRKVRNLERDPRATLVLHDSRPGFEVCGVTMRGRAEIVRGAVAGPLVERVHRRYLSERGLRPPGGAAIPRRGRRRAPLRSRRRPRHGTSAPTPPQPYYGPRTARSRSSPQPRVRKRAEPPEQSGDRAGLVVVGGSRSAQRRRRAPSRPTWQPQDCPSWER